MDKNGDGKRPGSIWQSQFTKLQRVLSIGNSLIRTWRGLLDQFQRIRRLTIEEGTTKQCERGTLSVHEQWYERSAGKVQRNRPNLPDLTEMEFSSLYVVPTVLANWRSTNRFRRMPADAGSAAADVAGQIAIVSSMEFFRPNVDKRAL